MGAVGGGGSANGSGAEAGFSGGGSAALGPRLQPSFGGALSKLLSASAGVEDGEMLMLHQFLEEQVVVVVALSIILRCGCPYFVVAAAATCGSSNEFGLFWNAAP